MHNVYDAKSILFAFTMSVVWYVPYNKMQLMFLRAIMSMYHRQTQHVYTSLCVHKYLYSMSFMTDLKYIHDAAKVFSMAPLYSAVC